MNRDYPLLVQKFGDDEAVVDTVIWITRDDDCINRKQYPNLFSAIQAAKKTGERYVIHDGHRWIDPSTGLTAKGA